MDKLAASPQAQGPKVHSSLRDGATVHYCKQPTGDTTPTDLEDAALSQDFAAQITPGLAPSQFYVVSLDSCKELQNEAIGMACSSKDPEHLLQICITGSQEHVRDIMMSSTDPNIIFGQDVRDIINMTFGPPEVNNKSLTFCTLLTIAVVRGQASLAKWLVNFAADPNGQYGFLSGAEGMEWSAPCAHAAAVCGEVKCVQVLIDGRADVPKACKQSGDIALSRSLLQ